MKRLLVYSKYKKLNFVKKHFFYNFIVNNSNMIFLFAVFFCGIIFSSYIFNSLNRGIEYDNLSASLLTVAVFMVVTVIFILSLIFGLSYIGSPLNIFLSFINGLFFGFLSVNYFVKSEKSEFVLLLIIIIPIFGIISALILNALSLSQKMSYNLKKQIHSDSLDNNALIVKTYIKYMAVLYIITIPLILFTYFLIK